MASDRQLLTLTNTDQRFYPLVGPLLANHEVHKQIGGVPWDDDGKTWIILTDPAHAAAGRRTPVTGVIAYRAAAGMIRAESCWTDNDDHDIRAILVQAVIDAVDPSPVVTTVRADYTDVYTSLGFHETATVGKAFVKLVRSSR
ncbi:hypothetical protein [Nocardia wallacei]|uniref:hypothetical protein n=1 Tax=Nocardia wallacei TaxID=480035 RepID=UPI0024577BD3|nr:hypothetical protein [Nocardia wallacei]